jgi:hypothetical protein
MGSDSINPSDENYEIAPESAYAPANPTDGRSIGEWESRFPQNAKKKIRRESFYLGSILLCIPILLVLIHLDCFDTLKIPIEVKKYLYAWIGGTLGGTLFSIKWLYHSVARNLWNADRWLWRAFTPHISAGLAFAFIVLISSGLINIFSPDALNKNTAVLGLSFLVGYFSDSAVAKLNEIANTIFGETTKGKGKKKAKKSEN